MNRIERKCNNIVINLQNQKKKKKKKKLLYFGDNIYILSNGYDGLALAS